MNQNLARYLAWLLTPFFRWWWAAITGITGLIAFAWTPDSFSVSRMFVSLGVIAFSIILFLTVTVLVQGWNLFIDRARPFEIVAIQKNMNQDLGSDWVIVFRGPTHVEAGSLLQVTRRLHDGVEVPFGVIRISGKNAAGLYQGTPIWTSSGHLNAFQKHEFSVMSLMVERYPNLECVQRAFKELEH